MLLSSKGNMKMVSLCTMSKGCTDVRRLLAQLAVIAVNDARRCQGTLTTRVGSSRVTKTHRTQALRSCPDSPLQPGSDLVRCQRCYRIGGSHRYGRQSQVDTDWTQVVRNNGTGSAGRHRFADAGRSGRHGPAASNTARPGPTRHCARSSDCKLGLQPLNTRTLPKDTTGGRPSVMCLNQYPVPSGVKQVSMTSGTPSCCTAATAMSHRQP